jgi:hypothetical protein
MTLIALLVPDVFCPGRASTLGGACHRLLGGGGSTSVRPILVGAGLPVASVPQKPAAGNGEVVVI